MIISLKPALVAAALLAISSCASILHAQLAIVMRPAVTITPNSPVTLATIASISGPGAADLGKLTLIPAADISTPADGQPVTITFTPDMLNSALIKSNTNLATTTIRGVPTRITIAKLSDIPTSPPSTPITTPITTPAPTPALTEPITLAQQTTAEAASTLRALIHNALSDYLNTPHEELRFAAANLSPADTQLLDSPVQDTWHYQVTPLATALTGRIPIRIEAYATDRLAFTRSIQVDAQILRTQILATNRIEREQVITTADLRQQQQWIPATTNPPVSIEQLLGSTARKRIETGRPVNPADLAPPIQVKRGEEIAIHVLSGGFILKIKARALANARDGELVTAQLDGSKKTVTARVSGRSRAVINTGSTSLANDSLDLLASNP